jgi:hypothetical protein
MSKICLGCDINYDDNPLLSDLNKNEIPTWSKKDGNYSLFAKLVSKKEYNPNKTKFKKNKTPDKTNITVRIPIKTTKPNKWILYWASQGSNNHTDVNNNPAKAYGNETNSGRIKTDDKGDGFLILNCPQLYSEDNVIYPRHVHYSILNEDNTWDESVKAIVVTCNLDFSTMKKIIENKTHIIINASEDKNIEYSFKLDYAKLNKMKTEDRLEKITEIIEKNTEKQKELHKKLKIGETNIKYIPIVIYCKNDRCDLSKKLIELLIKTGFVNIVKYSGGLEEWEDKKTKVDISDFEDSEVLYYEGIKYIHNIDTSDIINNDYTIIGQLISKTDKIIIDFNNPKYERNHNEYVDELTHKQIELEYDDSGLDDNIDINKYLNDLSDDEEDIDNQVEINESKIETDEEETNQETTDEEETNQETTDEEETNQETTDEEKEETTDEETTNQETTDEEEKEETTDEEKEETTDEETTNQETTDEEEKEETTDEEEKEETTDEEKEETTDEEETEEKQKGGTNINTKKITDSIKMKNNKHISRKEFSEQYRGWGLFQLI